MQALTPEGWKSVGDRLGCESSEERQAADQRAAQAAEVQLRLDSMKERYDAGKYVIIEKLINNSEITVSRYSDTATVELYNPTKCKLLSLQIQLGGRTYESRLSMYSDGIDPGATGSFEYSLFDSERLPPQFNWILMDVGYASKTDTNDFEEGNPNCISSDDIGENS